MNFQEQWYESVQRKKSVLCAGLDPADFGMGRKEQGLPSDANKLQWAMEFVTAVAPHCAAIKPNTQYWKGDHDPHSLSIIFKMAKDLGMVVIEDSKLADIGETNDAGLHYAANRAHAVTIAPYAGNLEQTTQAAHKRNLGVITMCLMSNPEYQREKNMLVATGAGTYLHQDIISTPHGDCVPRYVQLAHDARALGVDGVVIGAPSPKNHITAHELHRVSQYLSPDTLILCPGVGAQGGEAGELWKHFGPRQVIVNVGRALMFPEKGTHAETAERYKDMLNSLRGV